MDGGCIKKFVGWISEVNSFALTVIIPYFKAVLLIIQLYLNFKIACFHGSNFAIHMVVAIRNKMVLAFKKKNFFFRISRFIFVFSNKKNLFERIFYMHTKFEQRNYNTNFLSPLLYENQDYFQDVYLPSRYFSFTEYYWRKLLKNSS